MEPRTFQAREIKEALALVRREFGPTAVILGTRRVPGRALGLLGGTFVEVTAARGPGEDEDEPPQPPPPKVSDKPVRSPAPQSFLAEQRARRAQTARVPKRPIRELIADNPNAAVTAATAGVTAAVAPHAALRRRLLASMVPRDICERWLSSLPNPESGHSRAEDEAHLRAFLHQELGTAAPLTAAGSRVAVLIGPTGVGKTTTIAKLAAKATLVDGKRVAIVSLDDQRIGGTTALRAYARLLDLPLTTASASGGFARALSSYRSADLILVDTAGIPPAKVDEFDALSKRLGRAGEPVTTHLCLAASTRHEELDRILHQYAPASPSAVVATKIDEAVAVGTIFAAHARFARPLSYATTGQQVPDDIEVATPAFLIDLLLGGARA